MRAKTVSLLSAVLAASLFPAPKAAASVLVPIVLSAGGAVTSFYTSEMTLTNRGSTTATLGFTYIAAFGGGDGTGSDSLPAGEQRVDAARSPAR